MNKPVTAQELIDWIEMYEEFGGDVDETTHIIAACKAYLEEKENGT